MQYQQCQQPCPPHPSYGYPQACVPAPMPAPGFGSYYNTGNNSNASGIQKNGDVKVGNSKEKSGGVDIDKIGGNHTNQGGQQVSGNKNSPNSPNMQYQQCAQPHQPCPPHPSYGYPQACVPAPGFGSYYNTGHNSNGSGIQKNGDVKVGNSKEKSGGVDIGTIGGNHSNQGGQQVSGDVCTGNIC
ncbi:Translation initiation factor IF-2, partial [Bienertia sinuspersici]